MRSALIMLGLALAPLTAEARPVPQVQHFLEDEITKLATVQQPTPEPGSYAPMGDYQLAVFRLRLQAQVGFSIGVASVTVVPEAEFIWQ